jgi:hypothetical protein
MDAKTIARIRELEKQRDAGKSVPELDALYMKVDQREQRAYEAANPAMKSASAASTPVKRAKGGSVSSRADGIAQKGKTKGRML